MVTVLAEKIWNGEHYRKRGIGTVVQSDASPGGLVVFTPAHVVFGTDQVFAECDSHLIPLKLKAISSTSDGAVFEASPNAKSNLKPLIDGSGHLIGSSYTPASPFVIDATNLADATGMFWTVAPGHESQILHLPQAFTLHDLSTESVDSVRGHGVYSDLEYAHFWGNGLRPGNSGALSVDVSHGSVTGMVTETSLRNALSYGPSWDPEQFRSLATGKDALGAASGASAYIEDFQSHITGISNGASAPQSISELHLKTSHGDVTLQEACPSPLFSPISEWETIAKDWGGSGTKDWGGSGTKDWGGSGNAPSGPTQGTEISWTGVEIPGASDEKHYRYIGESSSTCDKPGILLPDGRRLIGLKVISDAPAWISPSGLRRIDSVEPLYRIWSQIQEHRTEGPVDYSDRRASDQLMDWIKRNGIFAGDPTGYNVIGCYASTSPNAELPQAACRQVRDENGEVRRLFDYYSDLQTVSGALMSSGSVKKGMACNAVDGSLHLKDEEHPDLAALDVSMTATSIRGSIKLGKCGPYKINQSKDFWSAHVRTPDFDVVLDADIDNTTALHGDGQTGNFRLDVLPNRINPRCLAGKGSNREGDLIDRFTWENDGER